jgi:GNAT superfamily N-acetyltransferase
VDEATLRLATPYDRSAIETLMRASIRDIFPSFYDYRQTSSAIIHVGVADQMLIDDGTYYVIEERGELIACGGWSRRDKLYTGSGPGETDARYLDPATEPARIRAMFTRSDRTRRGHGTAILMACEDAARSQGFQTLALMATLPGLQLYRQFGFELVERASVTLPDGVVLACGSMTRPITDPLPISSETRALVPAPEQALVPAPEPTRKPTPEPVLERGAPPLSELLPAD